MNMFAMSPSLSRPNRAGNGDKPEFRARGSRMLQPTLRAAKVFSRGWQRESRLDYPPISHSDELSPSRPTFSKTADQTNAERMLASWKGQRGKSRMPAASGTVARSGPKKRPMKIPNVPHFRVNARAF